MQGSNARRDRSAEREEMVEDQLQRRGIRSAAVLDAMRSIPRELFVPESMSDQAYRDAALPVDCGQTISQPYIVALMTELLEVTPATRVLEIGTGSGYQTAILARLAKHVYTVEWHLQLMTAAVERLEQLGVGNVTARCGDGSVGWPEYAPYDVVMVTAGAPDVPESLREQLAVGGRLVIPVGALSNQVLARVRRTASGFDRDEQLPCRFVRLVGREGWSD